MIIIVLTGAAVRLTGSGLGCPDWPNCFAHGYAGQWSIHPLIEFCNRLVTGALVVVTGATFVAAWLRSPRRRDLIVLSGLLILGVVGDATLGAFVVYSHLNPWLVSTHMLLSLTMVVVSALLYHRSKYLYGAGTRADVRNRHYLLAARWLWLPFILVLVTGTGATGSGPHAGSSQGQVTARRLPFSFHNGVMVHATAATIFLLIVLGLLFHVYRSGAPTPLRFGVRRLAMITVVQAAIGVTQYALHVPAVLVELHVAGATSLAIGVTQFHLRQTAHDREVGIAPSRSR